MTVGGLERLLRAILTTRFIEEPGFESRLIVEEVLQISQAELIARAEELTVDASAEKKTIHWAEKRATGYPLAYILGKKGFFKHSFYIEPGVLIPRPETEFVVSEALRRASSGGVQQVADLGSGSGCLGLSVLLELPAAQLWAVDVSSIANRVTHENSIRLQVSERVKIISNEVANWNPISPLDLVVANPPYIAHGDKQVQEHVHTHEPHVALYSGADGLVAIREWVKWAALNLRPQGIMVFEFGAGQSDQVQVIMREAGFEDLKIIRDFSGHDRVISGLRGHYG
jgi:release factor glutamine methyltransferase